MAGFLFPAACGLILTGLALVAASRVRLHRDRGFYPTTLAAISLFYIVFAIEIGDATVIALNTGISLAFIFLALLGFGKSMWLVVAGLAAHGFFDLFYEITGESPAPGWWAPFCLVVDGILALALTICLRSGLFPTRHK